MSSFNRLLTFLAMLAQGSSPPFKSVFFQHNRAPSRKLAVRPGGAAGEQGLTMGSGTDAAGVEWVKALAEKAAAEKAAAEKEAAQKAAAEEAKKAAAERGDEVGPDGVPIGPGRGERPATAALTTGTAGNARVLNQG